MSHSHAVIRKSLKCRGPVKILRRLPIHTPIDRTKDNLENTIAVKLRALGTREGNSINNISQIRVLGNNCKLIVQCLEILLRPRIVADLEELHADLLGGRIEPVELPRRFDQHAVRVVGGFAVSDANDIDRLRALGITLVLFNIRYEDVAQSPSKRCVARRVHILEDLANGGTALDMLVEIRVRVVEEVDVDAVSVVCGAYWRDGLQSVGCLGPTGACHRTRIVD